MSDDRTRVAQETAHRLFGVHVDLGARPGELAAGAELRRTFYEHAFADSWTRTALDDRSRSLVTLATLAALGAKDELRSHVAGALTLGVSAEEIVDLCIHVGVYAGVPRGGAAWDVASDVIDAQARRRAKQP